MVVPSLNPRASTRTRQPPTTSLPTRLTRSTMRAKEAATTDRTPSGSTTATTGAALSRTNTSSSFLAKGKEGFRKVSDKMKEKEKQTAPVAKKPIVQDGYSESLQAFLRIRPPPPEAELNPSKPYLEIKDSKAVIMTTPPDNARHHIPKPPHTYSFDHVFGPDAHQHDFFATTTLPLVDKLLKGDNGLMFAYGVSNSGKTYTIQGGNGAGIEERGVLPRAIDVVFNSISGLESKANLKCQGLADVVLSDEPDMPLGGLGIEMEPSIQDTVTVDRNFSYAVFVSYAEVYNEKVFDLLESILPSARPAVGFMPRTMSMGVGLSSGIGSNMSLAAMANGGAGILKRRALVLKNDPEGTGKYISGLNEIRVRTREEALAVFRSGQRARQVFGTMANRESSRSHGIFTVKVVRIHNGAPEDPESAQVSRLAIVDLAGSERTRNTASTGDRLKEAGNINKSLMVLGQCIEVLRANQQKMNTPSSLGIKRRLAVVPFRHSKLTEIFQSFFVGDGRAVMIVHVNPYDTGFDENSNVMKFSSIAQEISTVQAPRTPFPTLKKQISSQFSALRNAVTGHAGGQRIKVMVPVIPKPTVTAINVQTSSSSSFSRPTAASASRASTTGRPSAIPTSRMSRPPSRPMSPVESEPAPSIDAFTIVEEEIEVVEEEAEEDGDDEHDYLVDYLFEELKQLKTQLYESEMRSAAVEIQIREEVSKDMHEAMDRMRLDYARRLEQRTALDEEKTDMKLDILQRTMAADEDTSFEHSFMTEGDESMSSVTIDGDTSVLSDPFGPVRPLNTAPELSFVSASEDADESMEQDESEEDAAEADESLVDESEDEAHVEAAGAREAGGFPVATESESEDEEDEAGSDTSREEPSRMIGAADLIDLEADESGLAGSDEEDEIDSDAEGSELDDDDDSASDAEEDEDEDEDEYSADSSFADSVSSASTPPRPRRTVSPVKRGALPATPSASAKKPATVGRAKAPAKAKPLRDSNVQPLQLLSDDDDVVKKDTPAKKKRTLGKKVMTEDEIAAADERQAGGAEVRRLVRGL